MPNIQNKPILFVFDINGTLLKRTHVAKKSEIKENEIPAIHFINHYYQLRPKLHQLIDFLHSSDVQYAYWSSMFIKNVNNSVEILKREGLNRPLTIFGQEECDYLENPTVSKTNMCLKNLEKIAKEFDFDVDNCVLIDDTLEKKCDNNNFILVKEFTGCADDNEIANIIYELKKFISKRR